ncbi:MAG: hypothetical protein KF871_10965 [Hydrogenophaga sp.]|uniref:hypothetical protein n=1 Tax=Hydrogenophaga sp. TaxID=1904254 RepID=UPI001DBC5936|nr:hypothetical protein [Hydrogenophaga sp.]MBX3610403.1 hypothetical protein [Hydrogenophaga sp.]
MILYTEKGAGLHVAITAAGHWLREDDGQWVCSDEAAVQALIDGYTLEQAKAFRKAEVSALATKLRNKVIKGYSAGEMASWSIKLAEARTFAIDPLASCPLLTLEAQTRGVALASLAQRVLDNATLFAGAEAMIAGVEGMHRDSIDALADFDGVAAYDFTGGWPAT